MNRHQGKQANTAVEAENDRLESVNAILAKHKDMFEVLNRVDSRENYRDTEIMKLAELIFDSRGQSYPENFFLASTGEKLMQFLSDVMNRDLVAHPIYIVLNENEHWSVMAIAKDSDKVFVLFKSSLGQDLPQKFRTILGDSFGAFPFEIKFHKSKEQNEDFSSGQLALNNMEKIIEGLDKQKITFIENFDNSEFTSESELSAVTKSFKEKLTNKNLTPLLELSQGSDEFKVEFRKLVAKCIGYKELGALANHYNQVLQGELAKLEKYPNYKINAEIIKQAKNKFFNDRNVEDLMKAHSKLPMEQENPNQRYVHDIEKKFPNQMWALQKLLATENHVTRDLVLRQISKMYDIDYENLKLFSVTKNNEDETQRTTENEEKKTTENGDKFIESFVKIKQDIEGKTFKEFKGPEVGVRTLDEILSQLTLTGKTTLDSMHYSEVAKKLREDFNKVKEFWPKWQDKSANQIKDWALNKKGNLKSEEMLEAIAVMDRANNLVTAGHRLRDPQIVSVLVFLRSKENRGMLCQIQTGEGKTVILSVLASLKVLQGLKIDVITSNQVLALDGVDSRRNFYGLMAVSVAHNNTDKTYTKGPRSCYSADIVYGSIGNFQFDFLRDSFEGLGTRGGRKFEMVVLDEVDSMLIDNGGHIAKLAGAFPGIECLKYVYLKIWQELRKAEESLPKDVMEKLQEKSQQQIHITENSDEEIQAVEELEQYRKDLLLDSMNEIKRKTRASNPGNLKLIPAHLTKYANDSIDEWIENAIYAKYSCHENEKYVLKKTDGKVMDGTAVEDEVEIVPVDYQNTGVTMKNTIWSNGLHQFVQLKHNLQLTAETLTSSFVSNVGYIKFYKNNMIGMTGTLGSTAEQNFISKAYNVEFAAIATYKPKLFEELPGIVAMNDYWLNAVALESVCLAREKRSVLIICQTIKELQEIEKNINALKIIENFNDLKIRLYPDEDSSRVTEAKVGESEIIIATNIAGRGTDFKTTPELEKNGGLHVVVSFLPVNKRVEDQAFGRTARQGKSGTAQLIIKEGDVAALGLEIEESKTFDEIKSARDDIEKERLYRIENSELLSINFQDDIFAKFSSLYTAFAKNKDYYLRKDLKEFWAFWLHEKNFNNQAIESKNLDAEFEDFKRAASGILDSKEISHNPYYSIAQAETHLKANKLEESAKALDHAIALSKKGNSDILTSAYIKRFEVAMNSASPLLERVYRALSFNIYKKNENYKDEALRALQNAEKAISIEIQYLKSNIIGDEKEPENNRANIDFMNILIPNEKGNLLVKHLSSRYYALNVFCQQIQNLQRQIQDSGDKGLYIRSRVSNYYQDLKPVLNSEKAIKEAITDATLTELAYTGVETTYVLSEVHDVPDETLHGAYAQIGAGLALLAAGLLFPPAMPFVAPGAAILISEGITDIVIELIRKGEEGFDAREYIEGKLISYGISILTLGFGAIASCIKVLNKAIQSVRALTTILKNSKHFKAFSTKVASRIEKISSSLENMKHVAEFNKMNKIEQLNHLRKLNAAKDISKLEALGGLGKLRKLEKLGKFGKLRSSLTRGQLFKSSLKTVGADTIQDTLMSIVNEKLVTVILNRTLESAMPLIEKKVEAGLTEKLKRDELKVLKLDIIVNLTSEILSDKYGDMPSTVLREAALGFLRHSKSKAFKAISLGTDFIDTTEHVYSYTSEFSVKLNEQMIEAKKDKENHEKNENSDGAVKKIISTVTEHVAQKIYGILITLVSKYADTVVVTPIARLGFQKVGNMGNRRNQFTEEETNRIQTFAQIVNDHKTFGLKPGAIIDDLKMTSNKMTSELNLNKNSDNEVAQSIEKYLKAVEIDKTSNRVNQKPIRTSKPSNSSSTSLSLSIPTSSNKMGHRGALTNLINFFQQHVIINVKMEDGTEIPYEFGKKYKDNGKESIEIKYDPPTKKKPGHFDTPEGIKEIFDDNDCLFRAWKILTKDESYSIEQIKVIAENTSLKYVVYDTLDRASKLLENPITRELYFKCQRALLVGGSVREKRKLEEPVEQIDAGGLTFNVYSQYQYYVKDGKVSKKLLFQAVQDANNKSVVMTGHVIDNSIKDKKSTYIQSPFVWNLILNLSYYSRRIKKIMVKHR